MLNDLLKPRSVTQLNINVDLGSITMEALRVKLLCADLRYQTRVCDQVVASCVQEFS